MPAVPASVSVFVLPAASNVKPTAGLLLPPVKTRFFALTFPPSRIECWIGVLSTKLAVIVVDGMLFGFQLAVVPQAWLDVLCQVTLVTAALAVPATPPQARE